MYLKMKQVTVPTPPLSFFGSARTAAHCSRIGCVPVCSAAVPPEGDAIAPMAWALLC